MEVSVIPYMVTYLIKVKHCLTEHQLCLKVGSDSSVVIYDHSVLGVIVRAQ